MRGIRIARAGFIALAAVVALEVALGLVMRRLWGGEATPDLGVVKLVTGIYVALAAASSAAILLVARVPASTGARGAAFAAALISSVAVLLEVGYRVVSPSSGSIESMELMQKVWQGLNTSISLATSLLLALVVHRVGRAAGARWTGAAALGMAIVAVGAGALGGLGVAGVQAPVLWTASTAVYYAQSAGLFVLWVAMVFVVGRVTGEAPAASPGDRPAIDGAWGRVSSGIVVYLVGGAARVAFAVLAFFVMQGASGASSYGELHGVRDDIVAVVVLSGLAGLVMLFGVFRIARGPREAAPAYTTLVLMLIGMLLDVGTAKITYDAFDSVSGAFFAQDALPVMAAAATGLGIGAGAALLTAFAASAAALDHPALASASLTTRTVLLAAGSAGALLQLVIQKLPAALAFALTLLIVPALLYAAVRFLITAIGLAREIRARLAR